jgi:cell division septum initiation protein DivIVA
MVPASSGAATPIDPLGLLTRRVNHAVPRPSQAPRPRLAQPYVLQPGPRDAITVRPCGSNEGASRCGIVQRKVPSEAAEETRDLQRHADIGDKVNAIIKAAEAAAEEIGQNARREAREIVEQVEQQAAARIEELTREAARSRTEADQYARDMREAADSYGTQHRRSAEEEAFRLVAGAEKEAKETREAAQQKAEQIERDVGQRHETLKREARMLEERRQRVLESLRDLAAQLQDALVESVEKPPRDEALVDVLNVERRR